MKKRNVSLTLLLEVPGSLSDFMAVEVIMDQIRIGRSRQASAMRRPPLKVKVVAGNAEPVKKKSIRSVEVEAPVRCPRCNCEVISDPTDIAKGC